MKKNVLLLAGLLVAGLGLTSCGGNPNNTSANTESKPAETETSKPAESTQAPVETKTETETEVTPAAPVAFLEGEYENHGAGTAALYLLDAKNFKLDVEHVAGKMFSKQWDTTGTYSIVDGVIKLDGKTAGCKADDPDNLFHTDIPSYDVKIDVVEDAEFGYKTTFGLVGDKGAVTDVEMFGSWKYGATFLEGEYENHGAGTATLKLLNSKEFLLDVEHVAGKMFSKQWDTRGTYKIENGKITLTGKTAGCKADDPDNLFHTDIPSYDVNIDVVEDAEFGYKTTFGLVGDKGAVTDVEMFGAWPVAAEAK